MPSLPIAVYSRKSRYTGQGDSIGNQIELCRTYIASHFPTAPILVFEDEGFSGGNLNRPAFRAMMETARNHGLQAVVVYRLDRISRNVSDFSSLIDELHRLRTDFISIREQFDTSTPMGRAMMYIASVFSQLERETIAERIRDNMHELAKSGRWLGGVPPTGYDARQVKTVSVEGKVQKSCHLRLIPEEAALVRQVFSTFLSCGSLSAAETHLQVLGCRTKNDRPFSRFSIKAILQNPVYMAADEAAFSYFTAQQADVIRPAAADGSRGILPYRRTDQSREAEEKYLPVNQWIITAGTHPAIVSSADWIRAQQLLAQQGAAPRRTRALLRGLLYCSCGSPMVPKAGRGCDQAGRPRFSYRCSHSAEADPALCCRINLPGPVADGAVLTFLEKDLSCLSPCLTTLESSILHPPFSSAAALEVSAVSPTAPAFSTPGSVGGPMPSSGGIPSPSALCSLSACMEYLPAAHRRLLLQTVLRRIIWDGQRLYLLAATPPPCPAA